MGVHNCKRCQMLCADCHPLCMFCRTEVQRREIDRDLCEATTAPPRPEGYREMLGTVAVALLLFLALCLGGTMDYQAAVATQIGGK
jgi:ferric-dicitrate binding protein FerR (iron transport regulator)